MKYQGKEKSNERIICKRDENTIGGKTFKCYVCGKKFVGGILAQSAYGWHLIGHGVKKQL